MRRVSYWEFFVDDKFNRKEMKCYMIKLCFPLSLTYSYTEVSAVKHFYSASKYMILLLILLIYILFTSHTVLAPMKVHHSITTWN
jgi:hypothetical protein